MMNGKLGNPTRGETLGEGGPRCSFEPRKASTTRQGLPAVGDGGLDRTHTWGRTYWGGSLFCLVADVRIRERTANAHSFEDVLRALAASGADVESHWEIARVLDTGDRATGTDVLASLYGEMALAPGTVDLASLWKQLGVGVDGDRVKFDDTAPLASVRRGIAGR